MLLTSSKAKWISWCGDIPLASSDAKRIASLFQNQQPFQMTILTQGIAISAIFGNFWRHASYIFRNQVYLIMALRHIFYIFRSQLNFIMVLRHASYLFRSQLDLIMVL